ncbi:MAG: prepilin peptidase [Thermoguttaceae bacterium]|nr:prepilin peptidase [Thermoguttaceae bacterium]
MALFYLLLVFFFCFGASLGSFLNVVIWRLPNKMSLSFPASHCPKCGHPIRPWHNIPVLGWIILRGKCYDCHEPISARYPVVELIGGVGTLLIAFPYLATLIHFLSQGSSPSWDIWLSVAANVCFFLTSLAAGLILWDRNRIPFRLFLPAIVFWVWLMQNDLGLVLVLPVVCVLLTFIPQRLRRVFAIPVLILTVVWVLNPYFFWI